MEHSGFTFQQNAENAIEMLSLHSGGKVSEAMKMALLQEDAVIFRNIFKADEISVGVQEKLETAESTSSSIQRRSKRDKDTTTLFSHQRGMTPALLPPLPEAKKNGFCCFGC